jgi:hypothetical protein
LPAPTIRPKAFECGASAPLWLGRTKPESGVKLPPSTALRAPHPETQALVRLGARIAHGILSPYFMRGTLRPALLMAFDDRTIASAIPPTALRRSRVDRLRSSRRQLFVLGGLGILVVCCWHAAARSQFVTCLLRNSQGDRPEKRNGKTEGCLASSAQEPALENERGLSQPDIDPYSPCPCGSGKRYKWCCRKLHRRERR